MDFPELALLSFPGWHILGAVKLQREKLSPFLHPCVWCPCHGENLKSKVIGHKSVSQRAQQKGVQFCTTQQDTRAIIFIYGLMKSSLTLQSKKIKMMCSVPTLLILVFLGFFLFPVIFFVCLSFLVAIFKEKKKSVQKEDLVAA